MAVKIRLSRAGKKKVPFHRVIVVDSRKKRDGAFLDTLGTFDGLNGKLVLFSEDRYLDWVSKGAQPTDSAKKIYKMYKKEAGAKVAKKVVSKPKKVKSAPKKTVVAEPAEKK